MPASLRRYLRAGVRSTREVTEYLRGHGVSLRDAARAIAAYRASGVLDDRACAHLWAEHWARAGYSASAIRAKLELKGLPGDAMNEATRELYAPSAEEARARHVAAMHARRHPQGLTRSRLARALASRGFDAELIERILPDAER